MFQENELINLLISIGVLVFILIYWKELSGLHHFRIIFIAFLFLLASSFFTVIEGFSLNSYSFFNVLEHVCDLLRTAAFLVWGSLLFLPEKK